MSVYQQLLEREKDNNPIKVGVIGAGQMGYGMISQIAQIPGMQVAGISDIRLENANRARDAYLEISNNANEVFTSTDFNEVVKHHDVQVLVDATGVPEVGANLAMATLLNQKHLVLLNVEIDITIGPLLYHLFKSADLVYSGSDGDEPASTLELYEFAKSMGLEVLVAGKGKNNKLREEANPDTVREEAIERNMSPHMLASFADGTKTMGEMTLLANAIGFSIDKTGMHGIAGNLEETVAQLRTKEEGGVLDNYGVVEYVDGIAPGVFVIVKANNQGVYDQLNYMMKVDNDHHILYRPYHLASLETPLSIAKAVMNHQSSITPKAGQVMDTVAVAKKDIKAGEKLDGIGGYCVRGVIEKNSVVRDQKLVPIGLVSGEVIAKRDIANGTFISEDDVQLDVNTTVWKLRKLQDSLFND